MLSLVHRFSDRSIEYLYDAQDKRVGKKLDGVVQERYIYDGEDIALVVDAVGTLVERYLYGDSTDSVLAVDQDGTISWSLGDRQGSVVDVVDEGGTVLNHFVYDSFGNRTQTSGVEFRYGYTGQELDGETGLYYYRARYYDAAVGRFVSEEPMEFGAGDTNLYRYVFNSPTNWTDPTGMIVPLIAAGMVAMGVMNALIDVNVQLAVNNMTDKTDMNWASVGVSFATGMLGFGLAQKATQVSSLAWKIAGNPLAQRAVDSGIDGVGKVVENGINGKAWNNELAETVAGSFILGSAADAGIKGAGKAARSLDQFGGSAANWLRNPVSQIQESFDGGVMTMGGGSKWRLNAWDDSADPASHQFMAMVTGGSGGVKKPPTIIIAIGGRKLDNPIGQITQPTIPEGLIKTDIIGMPTKLGYERHHLISGHIAPEYEVMQIAASKYGYNINGRNNGMYLPDNITESLNAKLPLHKGSHLPSYKDAVRKELKNL